MLRPSFFPLVLALILLFALPGALFANPIPTAGIYTHVRPADPGHWPDIVDCDQIVSYTTVTGAIEFDLFAMLHFQDPPYGISEVQLNLDWPESWTFTGYEFAHGGPSSVVVNGNHAEAILAFPDCPVTQDELLPLMRCFVTVNGYGYIGVSSTDWEMHICSPDDIWTDFGTAGAQAGVVCDFNEVPCGLGMTCMGHVETPLLELIATQGEEIAETIDFTIYSDNPPCGWTCRGTEDWMQVSGAIAGEYLYTVSLEIDTSVMETGVYGGWVQLDSADDRSCTRIELIVIPPTAVDRTSWSRVKSSY